MDELEETRCAAASGRDLDAEDRHSRMSDAEICASCVGCRATARHGSRETRAPDPAGEPRYRGGPPDRLRSLCCGMPSAAGTIFDTCSEAAGTRGPFRARRRCSDKTTEAFGAGYIKLAERGVIVRKGTALTWRSSWRMAVPALVAGTASGADRARRAAPAKRDRLHGGRAHPGRPARRRRWSARRLERFEPAGVTVLTGVPRARGFLLDGYGMFFDVEIPDMNQSVIWSMMSVQRDRQVGNALDSLRAARARCPRAAPAAGADGAAAGHQDRWPRRCRREDTQGQPAPASRPGRRATARCPIPTSSIQTP